MALVFIKRSDGTKNKYRLPAKEGLVISIGRNPDCIISLPDVVGISGVHCSIVCREGSFYIKDEGSTNGTRREGALVTDAEPLQEGVEYQLGEAQLTYDAQGATIPALAVSAPGAATPPRAKLITPAASAASADGVPAPKRPPSKKEARPAYVPKKEDGFAPIFAVIIVVVSFIAGMTLRHWKDTGGFFPSEAMSSPPADASKPAAAKAKPAVTKPTSAQPQP